MSSINIQNRKGRALIEFLCKADRRRQYDLYIASCYFKPYAAKQFISKILHANIKLNAVYIYVDRKTATMLGKEALTRFVDAYDDGFVELFAVNAQVLFHSKAYALIALNEDEEVVGGSLVIGSANLTSNGLIGGNGNIETLLDTQDEDFIQDFYDSLSEDNLDLIALNDLENYDDANSINFKYALLNEGKFIHKWIGDIGASLAVKYKLSKIGKEQATAPIFNEAGFEIAAASISKRYFDFAFTPPVEDRVENIRRNYGIETYLGHWVARDKLPSSSDDSAYKQFKINLRVKLNNEMSSIIDKIMKDYDFLSANDLVELDIDPASKFRECVESLLSNDVKLERIYTKYYVFDLPYDIQQFKQIEELFDELGATIEARKSLNAAMKAVNLAIETTSLSVFREEINK